VDPPVVDPERGAALPTPVDDDHVVSAHGLDGAGEFVIGVACSRLVRA
jgi:hypothetical protein